MNYIVWAESNDPRYNLAVEALADVGKRRGCHFVPVAE